MTTRRWPLRNLVAVHLSLRVPSLSPTSEKAFLFYGLERHIPVILNNGSGLAEREAAEEIEVTSSAKVPVSSMILLSIMAAVPARRVLPTLGSPIKRRL